MKTWEKNLARVYHVEKVAKFFGGFACEVDPLTAWVSWNRYEKKLTRLSEIACGDGSYNQEKKIKRAERKIEELEKSFIKRWAKCFRYNRKFTKSFLLNQDTRGYALKFFTNYEEMSKTSCWTDWGKNGIFAPDGEDFYRCCLYRYLLQRVQQHLEKSKRTETPTSK